MNIEKLEAITDDCSLGLDMILASGKDVHDQCGLIMDESAMGTAGVRVIPAPGKVEGGQG